MNVQKLKFGTHPSGKDISLYDITNSNGLNVKIIDYGGIITHLNVPDKNGKTGDIVLGFDTLGEYMAEHPYFGGIIGRCANRISNGKFSIDGIEYRLAQNAGNNHLHGGIEGFDKKIWTSEIYQTNQEAGVILAVESPDMEEGYPGNVMAEVRYILTDKNELIIHYTTQSDKPTFINLTNHSYFNLSACKTPVYDHVLYLDADYITEVNDDSIPTGHYLDVTGTVFDFRKPKSIGKEIDKIPPGYDHNYVLNKDESELKLISRLEHPDSGRVMETLTTEPGVQLYTSNYLNGKLKGKNGISYGKHFAVCLETQHFPDTPNRPEFPSNLILPGKTYSQTTIYRFPAPR